MRAAVRSCTEPGSTSETPQREPAYGGHGLDAAAMAVRLHGVPHVDDLAFDADGWLFASVGEDDRPVQDHMGQAPSLARSSAWCRSGAWAASTAMTSSTYR